MSLTEAGAAFVRLRAPEGATSCSWNGESFAVDKKGWVKVPEAAAGDLVAHGFITPGDVPE